MNQPSGKPSAQDFQLLCSLRANAREKLTTISRLTQIPVSTLHDKLRNSLNGVVRRHTALLDFEKLGFACRAHVLINAPTEQKAALRDHLAKHPNVNSAFKVNNGFSFWLDVVFERLESLDDFLDELEQSYGVTETQTHYIIDEIKRESFLTDPVVHAAPQPSLAR